MKEQVRIFLMSGLLEEYAMGLTSPEQNVDIEKYIQEYPEVSRAYDRVQDDLEKFAKSVAERPPQHLKDQIFHKIPRQPGNSNFWKYFGLASLLTALFFGFQLWNSTKEVKYLKQDKIRLATQLNQLKTDCEALMSNSARMAFLSDSETEAWGIKGNNRAPQLRLTAYWNDHKEEGHLMVHKLPKPPDGHCYQLWVDVKGEMVPAAILEGAEEWIALKYRENIESFNLTIEKIGGADHPNVESLVAHTNV